MILDSGLLCLGHPVDRRQIKTHNDKVRFETKLTRSFTYYVSENCADNITRNEVT